MQHFKLPNRSLEVTEAECIWLTFLRDVYGGEVSEPTLRAVQALRQAVTSK